MTVALSEQHRLCLPEPSQGASMSDLILCRRCQDPIDASKRSDSIYCSDKCRLKTASLERRTKNRERHAYEQSIPTRFALWLREFEERLRKQAPRNSVGYQTGLWVGDRYFWFPVVPAGKDARGNDRTRLTFHRKRSSDEFFLLSPFEPPSVPVATHYQIRFVSRLYPHPHLDDQGSFVEIIPYEIRQSNIPLIKPGSLPTSKQKR